MANTSLSVEKSVGDLGAVSGIVLASIAFVMELTLLPLILTELQQDLSLNLGQLSWVFNTYAAAVALTPAYPGTPGLTFSVLSLRIWTVPCFAPRGLVT